MSQSFLTPEELDRVGLAAFGEKVQISRRAVFYHPERIRLGHHVRIDDFCLLTAGGGLDVGNYVHVGAHSAIYGGSGVTLEDYAGLSPRCTLFSESDDFSGESLIHPFFPDELKPGYVRGALRLGRFCQLGAGCTVLPGVTLEEGAVVGAHSLVTQDCEAWAIHAGTPAKLLKRRSRKVLELAARHEAMRADDGSRD